MGAHLRFALKVLGTIVVIWIIGAIFIAVVVPEGAAGAIAFLLVLLAMVVVPVVQVVRYVRSSDQRAAQAAAQAASNRALVEQLNSADVPHQQAPNPPTTSTTQAILTQAVPNQRAVLNQEKPTLPPPPPLAPTASMLMYLFADRLIPAQTDKQANIKVPCKDATVTSDLVRELFVVTLWSLREQGIIRLEAFEEKRGIGLRVIIVKQAERPGLEGEILNTVKGDQKNYEVFSLIRKWFRGTYSGRMITTRVVSVPAYEAIVYGYIDSRRASIEHPIRVWPIKTSYWRSNASLDEELEPNCEKIATLEEIFHDLAVRWEAFKTAEAELYRFLVGRCASAITASIQKSTSHAGAGGDGGG